MRRILGYGILGSIVIGLFGIVFWIMGWVFIPIFFGCVLFLIFLIALLDSGLFWILPVFLFLGIIGLIIGLIIWSMGWGGVIAISGAAIISALIIWSINLISGNE